MTPEVHCTWSDHCNSPLFQHSTKKRGRAVIAQSVQRWDHRVQNGSGVHPASYPMGMRGSFPGDKEAGAWSWQLTSISYRGQRM